MAKQKKKRNKKYKKPITQKAQPGVLRKSFSLEKGEDFFARFIFGMGKIRSCVYKHKDSNTYEKSFNRCFQNLVEMRLAKEKVTNLINEHLKKIENKEDGLYHGNQIDIDCPIGNDLNLFFKDFFIRGIMAIDGLKKHAEFMELKIDFLFSDQDKAFKKGLEKFPLDKNDERFESLLEFIKNHKKNWYSNFRELRRKIEHEGWSLEKIEYYLDAHNKVQVVVPKVQGKEILSLVNDYWDVTNHFCEEIITFLLGLKLDDEMFIQYIPKDKRNKHTPVKYIVSHKSMPGVQINC
jgi:hypothetical protein